MSVVWSCGSTSRRERLFPALIVQGVKESLPNADITFDRFHDAKILGDAVERVRRSEWRRDKTIKDARYALLKNPDTLREKQRTCLDEIMTRNSALAEVYRMKETFRDFYRQLDEHSARGILNGWVAIAQTSTLKPLLKAAKTIKRRAADILRWHQTRLTNAVLKGLNSLLQAAKRKARGLSPWPTSSLESSISNYLLREPLDD